MGCPTVVRVPRATAASFPIVSRTVLYCDPFSTSRDIIRERGYTRSGHLQVARADRQRWTGIRHGTTPGWVKQMYVYLCKSKHESHHVEVVLRANRVV